VDDLMRSEFEKFAKEQGYGSPWNTSDTCPGWPLLSRNACWAWAAWQRAWVLAKDLPDTHPVAEVNIEGDATIFPSSKEIRVTNNSDEVVRFNIPTENSDITSMTPHGHEYGTLLCHDCKKPMPQTAIPAAAAWCADCSSRTSND
jgi:hypothetical protein